MDKIQDFDLIVIGAGAAGLFCAANAGQLGKRVLVLEHAEKIGKKILISGGGRCNFTNVHSSPKSFICQNPHFVKSALSRYTPDDFLALMKRYNIAYHEKTLGQLFCDNSARDIVAMLKSECDDGGVTIKTDFSVNDVSHDGVDYLVNDIFKTKSLVIATGGPSIPKMGATDFAYRIAKQFKIPLIQPRPALVPFTLSDQDQLFKTLSGIACDTIATANGVSFPEATLFTHRGLSGPAILQISSYWNAGDEITLDLYPNQEHGFLKSIKAENPKWHLRRALGRDLPDRVATAIAEKFDHHKMLGDTPDRALEAFEVALKSWRFKPNGTEGFAKAEVTVGGIDTNALSSKTMECKKQSGLYFIGEAVDVTGWLGGYNFQWAWASGYACAMGLVDS